jgi:hypothetical protein
MIFHFFLIVFHKPFPLIPEDLRPTNSNLEELRVGMRQRNGTINTDFGKGKDAKRRIPNVKMVVGQGRPNVGTLG